MRKFYNEVRQWRPVEGSPAANDNAASVSTYGDKWLSRDGMWVTFSKTSFWSDIPQELSGELDS